MAMLPSLPSFGEPVELKDGSLTETSESGSSSSDSDSSNRQRNPQDTANNDKRKKKKKKSRMRTKLLLKPHKQRGDFLVPKEPIIYEGRKKHRTFVVFPEFFSLAEIQQTHIFCTDPSVKVIEDRSKNLTYKHVAHRVELQCRALEPRLYNKIVEVVRQTDDKIWGKLPNVCYPEMEYIIYDKQLHGGTPGYIEPHVDNKSAVTILVMLSHSKDYEGGINYFARPGKHAIPRCVKLEQGDLVIFRGERLLHWITPVTYGRRVILQNEMSRV